MKFGINFAPTDYAIRPDELAVAVEERGFESLFLADHTHIPVDGQTEGLDPFYSHTHDIFVAMGFALQATSRLLVGSGVLLVTEHHPITTAKALASLDVLSGGRLLFGIGAGWIRQEMAHFGVDPDRRWSTTVDRVRAIKAIWSNEVAEHHGEFVDFGPIWSWPKPFRPGGPPILVGGNGPRVPERAVEIGDEWFPEDEQTIEELGVRIADLQEMAARAGRGPIPVTLFSPRDPSVDRLKRLAEIGVHRVTLGPPAADRDTVLAHLDRFAELREAFGRG